MRSSDKQNERGEVIKDFQCEYPRIGSFGFGAEGLARMTSASMPFRGAG